MKNLKIATKIIRVFLFVGILEFSIDRGSDRMDGKY